MLHPSKIPQTWTWRDPRSSCRPYLQKGQSGEIIRLMYVGIEWSRLEDGINENEDKRSPPDGSLAISAGGVDEKIYDLSSAYPLKMTSVTEREKNSFNLF